MAEMFECPSCGAMNKPGQKSCKGCGELLKYYCPNCNAVVDQTQSVCPGCGSEFNWAASEQIDEVNMSEGAVEEHVAGLAEDDVDMVGKEDEVSGVQNEESAEVPGKPKVSIRERINSLGANLGRYVGVVKAKLSSIKLTGGKEEGTLAPEGDQFAVDEEHDIITEPEIQQESEQTAQVYSDRSEAETEEEVLTGQVADDVESQPDMNAAEQVDEEETVEVKQDTTTIKERVMSLRTYLGGLISSTREKLSDIKLMRRKEPEEPVADVGEAVIHEEPEAIAEATIQEEAAQPVQPSYVESDVEQKQPEREPVAEVQPPDLETEEQVEEEPHVEIQQAAGVLAEEVVPVEEEKETVPPVEAAAVPEDVSSYQRGVPSQGDVIMCYYHPDRVARYTCPRCGQPICRECYGIRNGEIQCWNCYHR
jgi:RNA polymerase subunit RPABC4/transcription elongation factor Spt4